VEVRDDVFVPATLQVAAGQTVTWTWGGSNPHTVTFDAGGTSSTQMTTGTFQRQFPAAGSFTYHCVVHAAMTGTITVQ
jgi:plastocyanin